MQILLISQGWKLDHVRFTPESGHVQCTSACPLCANSDIGGYSITWFARSKTDTGRVTPIAFAVLRLIASSNWVGCSTGISLGLTPRSTFATCHTAARSDEITAAIDQAKAADAGALNVLATPLFSVNRTTRTFDHSHRPIAGVKAVRNAAVESTAINAVAERKMTETLMRCLIAAPRFARMVAMFTLRPKTNISQHHLGSTVESRHSAVQPGCPLWVKSGHVQRTSRCPLSARSGHLCSRVKFLTIRRRARCRPPRDG